MPETGERVPVVFQPRFTALTGAAAVATTYISTPMDMLAFTLVSVTCSRSKIIGATVAPVVTFQFEQSSDLVAFVDLGAAFDPAAGLGNVLAEVNFMGDVFRRYVRLKITLDNTFDSTVTVFAIGWAARTQS